MDAEAKVKLNAEPFEAGAARVSRAAREMAKVSAASARTFAAEVKAIESEGLRSTENVSGGVRGVGRALRATTGEAGALRFGLIEISQSLGLGTAGVIAFGVAAEGLVKVIETVRTARKELRDAEVTRTGFVSSPNAGADVFEQQIAKLSESRQKLSDLNNSFGTNFSERLVDIATGKTSLSKLFDSKTGPAAANAPTSGGADRDEEIKNSRASTNQLVGSIAASQARLNSLQAEGVQYGEKSVRARELEVEFLAKADALRRKGSAEEFNERPLIAQLRTEYDLKEKIAARDYKDQQDIRTEGINKQIGGNNLAEEGARYGEKRVKSAQLELELTQKINDLRRQGVSEGFDPQSQIDQATRATRLQQRIAEQESGQSERQRFTQAYNTSIVGETTRDVTPADIARFASVNSVRVAQSNVDTAKNDLRASDPSIDQSALRTKVAETSNALREEVQRLSDAQGKLEQQTKTQQLLISGQRTLAEYSQKEYAYQDSVAVARRTNNTLVEAELTKQREIERISERLAYTPQRAAAEDAATRASNNATRNSGLQSISRDISGNAVSGYDPLTRQRRNLTKEEQMRANGVTKLFEEKSTGAREADGNASDFNARFHSKGVAEENRPKAPQKPPEPKESPLESRLEKLTGGMERIAAKLGMA